MSPEELAFLEEMLESAELLHCVTCQDDTLQVYEEILDVASSVTEAMMRCTSCMNCQLYLIIN
jgi:hypothetical protein